MIGDAIKEMRRLKKVKQRELAEYLGVSTSTIGMYEQNRREPDIETLKKIALFFGASVDSIINYDPDSPELRRLLALLRSLTPEDMEEMQLYVDLIVQRRKREREKAEAKEMEDSAPDET